jgi:hypothetical protein
MLSLFGVYTLERPAKVHFLVVVNSLVVTKSAHMSIWGWSYMITHTGGREYEVNRKVHAVQPFDRAVSAKHGPNS